MSINFACPGCRRPLKFSDNLAGRKGTCPNCKTPFRVPQSNGRAAPAPRAASAPRRAAAAPAPASDNPFAAFDSGGGVDAGDGSYSPSRYRKKRGHPFLKLFIFLFFLLILAVGGAYAAAYFKLYDPHPYLAKVGLKNFKIPGLPVTDGNSGTGGPGGGPEPSGPITDLYYMPEKAQAIIGVNFDVMNTSKAFHKLKEEGAKNDLDLEKSYDANMKKVTGVPFSNVSRLTFAPNKQDGGIILVKTRTPVKSGEITSARDGEFIESKIGKHKLYEGSKTKDAFCIVDENTLLIGKPPEELKAILERNKAPEFKPELAAAAKQFDATKALSIAAVPQEVVKDFGIPNSNAPGVSQIQQAKTLALQVDVSSGLALSATVTCQDDAAAKALKEAIENYLTLAKGLLAKALAGKPEEALVKKVEQAISQLKVDMNGAEVTITFALGEDGLVELVEGTIKAAPSLMPKP